MNKIELSPGIMLYKNVYLDIADEIMSMDTNLWEYEMTQTKGNVVLDLEKRNTSSFEIPNKINDKTSELHKRFSKSLNETFHEKMAFINLITTERICRSFNN